MQECHEDISRNMRLQKVCHTKSQSENTLGRVPDKKRHKFRKVLREKYDGRMVKLLGKIYCVKKKSKDQTKYKRKAYPNDKKKKKETEKGISITSQN